MKNPPSTQFSQENFPRIYSINEAEKRLMDHSLLVKMIFNTLWVVLKIKLMALNYNQLSLNLRLSPTTYPLGSSHVVIPREENLAILSWKSIPPTPMTSIWSAGLFKVLQNIFHVVGKCPTVKVYNTISDRQRPCPTQKVLDVDIVRRGKCPTLVKRNVSNTNTVRQGIRHKNCPIWIISDTESVRDRSCRTQKVSEMDNVRRGKGLTRKAVDAESILNSS